MKPSDQASAGTAPFFIHCRLDPRHSDLVPYREAVYICAAALASGHLSEESLIRLLESARSTRAVLGEGVSGMLSLLLHRFPSVREAIRAMAHDKKAHVRVNALLALDASEDQSLNREILALALHDRCAQVRFLAADRTLVFGLRSLFPDLEATIAREKKPELRAFLKREIHLLRDEFRVRKMGDEKMWINCA
jgi:hypothetical protein